MVDAIGLSLQSGSCESPRGCRGGSRGPRGRDEPMITERIRAMLEACEAGRPTMPPTVLFNENWLLRIVLDWLSEHGEDRTALSPYPKARWFSEAWLPSAFLARYRGDR